MKRKKKIKAAAFLRAAEILEKELKKNEEYGSTCCEVLAEAVGCAGDFDGLHETPEFKYFKKHFGPKKDAYDWWFGKPYKEVMVGVNTEMGDYYQIVPHPTNQKKRIKALRKLYTMAKRLK